MNKKFSWATTGSGHKHKTHEEICDIFLKAGFSGIELGVSKLKDEPVSKLESIGKLYAERGLEIQTVHFPFDTSYEGISSVYETLRSKACKIVLESMECAAALGAKIGIQHPSSCRYNIEKEGLSKYLKAIGKSFEKLLPAAKELDIILAIENMPARPQPIGQVFCSEPEHFTLLIQEFEHPNLKFCLDTGHALMAKHDTMEKFFSVMEPYLVAFHLQDNAGDRDSHLAPGKGLIDWDIVFQRMAKMNYNGIACIEAVPFTYGPEHSLKAWQELVLDMDRLVDKALEVK